MDRWSEWRPLYHVDGLNIKPSEVEFEGPETYILAVTRGRSPKHTLYVGSTNDLKTRLYSHSHGDNTNRKDLANARTNGYKGWYQVHMTRTAKRPRLL